MEIPAASIASTPYSNDEHEHGAAASSVETWCLPLGGHQPLHPSTGRKMAGGLKDGRATRALCVLTTWLAQATPGCRSRGYTAYSEGSPAGPGPRWHTSVMRAPGQVATGAADESGRERMAADARAVKERAGGPWGRLVLVTPGPPSSPLPCERSFVPMAPSGQGEPISQASDGRADESG